MSHDAKHLQQEDDKVNTSSVLTVGIGSLVIFAISVWITWLLMDRLDQQILGPGQSHSAVPKEVGQPEVGIVNQWLFSVDQRYYQHEDRQKEKLSTFGWVDREKKIARIPIDQAMELVVSASQAGKPLTLPGRPVLPPALLPGEAPRPIKLPESIAPSAPSKGAAPTPVTPAAPTTPPEGTTAPPPVPAGAPPTGAQPAGGAPETKPAEPKAAEPKAAEPKEEPKTP